MKFLVGVLVLLAVAGGVYQWGGNSLDEKQVREYYRGVEQATLAFDDELLCGMLAEDYQQSLVMKSESSSQESMLGKQEYCQDTARSMAMLRRVQEALGGHAPMRYEQTIKSIRIADDGRSARVETSALLDMPGVRLVSRSRDTVERRRWRVRATRSVAVVHAGRGG
ncbi:hypothetical protein CQ393_16570 [Stenotrophomonas sp. MYb238]|uniref:hypothetical protein n=1 Tax=Stenotrophomonas sp. MYb238 TaxID=2040281 RepID=UPI001290983F|nr:hypothetical protein [Stenotrophomonas sp. MYb238]MQP77495.1 hypothetical protein [Stenotrophomonas sp. MYb238]